MGYLSVGRMGRWDNRACVYACVYVVIMHVCVLCMCMCIHKCVICVCMCVVSCIVCVCECASVCRCVLVFMCVLYVVFHMCTNRDVLLRLLAT